MFLEITLLIIIYFSSVLYNTFILPIIFTYISSNIYNNLIISLLILIQIDNFILYQDYKKVLDEKNSIFLNQLKVIIQKQKLSKSFNEKFHNVIINS